MDNPPFNQQPRMLSPSRHLLARKLRIGLFLLLVTGSVLRAQRIDSRGKEFWIAFMLTHGAADPPNFSLSISSSKPTKGRITYVSSGESTPISIDQADRAYHITLDTFEL